MKKNLIFSMLAGVLLTVLLSFTIIGSHDNVRTHKKVKATKVRCFSCSSAITNLTGSGGTFNWTVSGSYDHFNYGGYYQAGGGFSGSTTGLSATITPKSGGGRFNVTPVCADGTLGTPMNILF